MSSVLSNDMNVQLVIPLAGEGQRFKDKYDVAALNAENILLLRKGVSL